MFHCGAHKGMHFALPLCAEHVCCTSRCLPAAPRATFRKCIAMPHKRGILAMAKAASAKDSTPTAKRAKSTSAINAKVKAAECFELQEAAQKDLDIAMIVQELQALPEKIRRCLAAVRSNQFLPKDTIENTFGEGTTYMLKSPRNWLEKFLESKHSRFDSEARRLLAKQDRVALHKLFYRACLVDKASHVSHMKISAFTSDMDLRFKQCGQDLSTVDWNADGQNSWQTSGAFILEPRMPADADPAAKS